MVPVGTRRSVRAKCVGDGADEIVLRFSGLVRQQKARRRTHQVRTPSSLTERSLPVRAMC